MKTLIVALVLLTAHFAQAGTTCNIRNTHWKVIVGSDQAHGDYLYIDNHGFESITEKIDKTYLGDRGTVVDLEAKTVKVSGIKLHLENCYQSN